MFGMKRTMADPRRWISKGCPKGLDEIANVYVKREDFNDRMEREVRDWIPTFSCTDDGIAGRRRGAGCIAALEALRDMDGDMDSLPTQRRGSDSENGRAWATTTLKDQQGRSPCSTHDHAESQQGRSPCSTAEGFADGLLTVHLAPFFRARHRLRGSCTIVARCLRGRNPA